MFSDSRSPVTPIFYHSGRTLPKSAYTFFWDGGRHIIYADRCDMIWVIYQELLIAGHSKLLHQQCLGQRQKGNIHNITLPNYDHSHDGTVGPVELLLHLSCIKFTSDAWQMSVTVTLFQTHQVPCHRDHHWWRFPPPPRQRQCPPPCPPGSVPEVSTHRTEGAGPFATMPSLVFVKKTYVSFLLDTTCFARPTYVNSFRLWKTERNDHG